MLVTTTMKMIYHHKIFLKVILLIISTIKLKFIVKTAKKLHLKGRKINFKTTEYIKLSEI